MEQHMMTRKKLVRGALHRKQQESSSKTGTVSSLVPSTRSNYGKVALTEKLCRNQPENCQHIHSMHRKCPTFNGRSNIPLFDRDRLDGKMPPLYRNMLLGKVRKPLCSSTDQVWKSSMTCFPYNVKPVQCY